MFAHLLRIAPYALCALLMAAIAERATAQEPLHFCFNEWPPYSMAGDGDPNGISVDILKAAAQKAGYEVRFSELPWNRCLEQVRQGRIDAVIDAAKRPEFVQGPTSFSYYSNTVWVQKASAVQGYSPDAFDGLTVGLVHGYEYPKTLLEDLKRGKASFEYSVDDPTNIRKLAFGRIDAIIADMASTLLFVRQHKLSLRPLDPTHSADPLFISFNSDKTDVQGKFDRALAALLKDGGVDAVYQRYLGIDFCGITSPDQLPSCQSPHHR